MRKIAIVKMKTVDFEWNDYNDLTKLIATKITDWEEVSEEDLQMLKYFQNSGEYVVIELLPNQKEFIHETVNDYKIYTKKMKDQEEKRKKEREQKKLRRKQEKEQQKITEKKKLLEQLKKELDIK